MKYSKITVLVVVAAFVMLAGVYQQGKLDAASSVSPAKVGVVDVTKVLENCAANKKWQVMMQQKQKVAKSEFDLLKEALGEIETNLQLQTRGTEDYFNRRQEYAEKKAGLAAKNEAYQDRVTSEMQRWTEELYQQLLETIADVAKDKGLDIVVANESLMLPSPSLQDFMLTVKTRTLLYHNSQYDLTAEVLIALDKATK